MSDDYYETLGLSRDASSADIQKAYRCLARKHHPDMNPDDEGAKERFKRVQQAFDVLGDAKKREMYDRYGSSFESMRAGGGPAGGPEWRSASGDDIDFAQFFGEKFGSGVEGGGWSDLFGQFRRSPGGRSSRHRATPQRGGDIHHDLEVPFRTSVLGGTAELSLRRAGGKVERLSVKIPAGIADGGKIRLRGQGEAVTRGPRGDLFITIRVATHRSFARSGNHLIVKVPVTIYEAAHGAKIDIPTPAGTIAMTVPPCTSSGAKLRLRGRGIKPPEGPPGDLLAEIQIVLPKSFDDESRELIEKLAAAGPPNPRADLRW
jgi:curved DNA-binding protein